jgi:hypothetical protein
MKRGILAGLAGLGIAMTVIITSGPDEYCVCMTVVGDGAPQVTRLDDCPTPEEISETGQCNAGTFVINRALSDRQRLVLCCDQVDPESGQTSHWVGKQSVQGGVSPGCRILDPLVEIETSFGQVETPTDVVLRNLCAPCPVSPGSWGVCPRCMCDGPRGCRDACPELEEGGL